MKFYICSARSVAKDETNDNTTVSETNARAASSYCPHFIMKKVFGCGGLSNVNKLISFHFIRSLSVSLRVTYTQDHQCVCQISMLVVYE